MADFAPSQVWLMRLMFFAMCLLIMFFHLLPLNTLPHRWAGPDLLLGFSFAWSLRRPDLAPITAIAVILLLADFLFQRPPGLLPLLVVVCHEYLQRRATGLREASFMGEWLAVAMVLVAITLMNRIILSLAGVDQANPAMAIIQLFMTIGTYPAVVVITQSVFRVRKLAPSEIDARGTAR